MKRFYCTICKKVKRVQDYPMGIRDEYATGPEYRIGKCAGHSTRRGNKRPFPRKSNKKEKKVEQKKAGR
jgi:hypothetical protein